MPCHQPCVARPAHVASNQGVHAPKTGGLRWRCFVCVQDIYTGDFVDIYVITKDGTAHEVFELKKD